MIEVSLRLTISGYRKTFKCLDNEGFTFIQTIKSSQQGVEKFERIYLENSPVYCIHVNVYNERLKEMLNYTK